MGVVGVFDHGDTLALVACFISAFLMFQNEIKSTMKITTYQFENLYAWYSWPNVVLPIIGGYFIDNVFGMRLSTVIFASFILLGKLHNIE